MLPGQMFENNRVKFYMQTEVSELRAQEGKVSPSLASLLLLLSVPSACAQLGPSDHPPSPHS